MKKNKGFTLIEMLAVLVIIILLTSVVVPSIINLITKNKNKLSSQTKEIIYSAASLYLDENNNYSKSVGNVYCITLASLVNDGKLEAPINDFKTGKEIDLSKVVVAKVNKYSEFEFSFTSSKDCTEKRGYNDIILNGSDPDLLDNMIPVIYDNGTWKKANTDEKWYSYEEQMWANAVTVSNDKYFTLESGTAIEGQDISGFYVWIPRFEYKKVESITPKKIQVNFISESKTNASRGYTIPDVFKFDLQNLNGIWVSKFESSSDDSKTLCSQTKTQENCNVNTNNAIFTYSKTPWTNISLSVAYSVIDKMNMSGNIYGFDLNNSDTHLIKNTEWNVITYLTMSSYGKFGNSTYSESEKEIGLSNCTTPLTGTYCDDSVHDYKDGVKLSTTGNVYGIYDLNGNSDEFVMANLNDNLSSSGFKTMPDAIYYDKIDENDSTLTQTKGWYNDTFILANNDNPWIIRGGNYSDDLSAGIFAYKNSTGAPSSTTSFRAVIIKK